MTEFTPTPAQISHFESWAKSEQMDLSRGTHRRYVNTGMQWAWEGYALACAHIAEREAPETAPLAVSTEVAKPQDLSFVITWLEGRCDPLAAAAELRLYQAANGLALPPAIVPASLPAQEAQPLLTGVPPLYPQPKSGDTFTIEVAQQEAQAGELEAYKAWFDPDDGKNYRDCWTAACAWQRDALNAADDAIAEVCITGGESHIEFVVEEIDRFPAGMKLYARALLASQPSAPQVSREVKFLTDSEEWMELASAFAKNTGIDTLAVMTDFADEHIKAAALSRVPAEQRSKSEVVGYLTIRPETVGSNLQLKYSFSNLNDTTSTAFEYRPVCFAAQPSAPSLTDASHHDSTRQVLENVRNCLERINNEGKAITDTLWYSDHETLFDYIDAELDRVPNTGTPKAIPRQAAQAGGQAVPDDALLTEIAYGVHHGWPAETLQRLEAIFSRINVQRASPKPEQSGQGVGDDTKRLDWLLPNLHPANFGFRFDWESDAEFLSKWRAAIDDAMPAAAPKPPAGQEGVE